MDDGTLARVDALKILRDWMDTEEFPDRKMVGIPPFRRGFVMDLVYTTLRNVRALDFATAPFVRNEPQAHAMPALLLGACQLLKMETTVAEHAAIHATVEALKSLDGEFPAKFVNAVLRNCQRQKTEILARLVAAPLAVRESHPDEQVDRWTARFGAERTAALCAWDNMPANVTVLTLPRGPTVEALLASFAQAGVKAQAHPGFPKEALIIPHGSRVEDLPGFAKGAFSIQDPATLAAVKLLAVKPGLRVLDACAAPGGKTIQIGLRLDGKGALVAMDCWRDRLPPLEENVARFGLSHFVRVEVGDAKRVTPRDFGGKLFDRILLDVPCSNTGVQRRRADSRWRFSAERLATLAETQSLILENAVRLLAPGGKIVYSTCSLEEEENQAVVAEFLHRHKEFRLEQEVFSIPPDREADGSYAVALSMWG